jgi:peptidoglycan/LPS O-acetylase OafA/YrhL
MNKQKGRNNTIEFWRFIFICAICIMHFSNSYFGASPYFGDAYVATEFFFIVSGYLLVMSFYKNKLIKERKISAWKYTWNKALKLYPYYILSFAAVFVFVMVSEKADLIGWITNLSGSVWELIFLQISGLKCFRLFNYPTWYISAMLIAGYFIYALLELVEEKYMKFIMPLSVLVIYCIFSRETGHIDVWGGNKILGISDALMRAFAGMSLGGICYSGSDLLKQKQFDRTKQLLLSVCEVIAFLLAVVMMMQTGHTQIDFYIIGLLAVGVTLSFSGQTLVGKLFDFQLFSWFGKISYPVFLNQIFVIYMIGALFQGLGYSVGVVTFMVILIVLSAIEVILVEGVKRVINK